MAQTNFTPIQLYSSSTPTNTPAAGNLINDTKGSELAVNIADGKLFYKDTSNNVQTIANKTWVGTVTSVSGTSPVAVATGTSTPVVSLSAGYGDTQNPYASKTANNFLAAPNGSAGVPTFRTIVAADIPTLNQNTTGSAATLTTARNLWGQSFNGSADISAPLYPAAGSVSAPAYSVTGDTNTGIFFPAADTIAFTEGGVESMRIDSSGNVGIGTSSPSEKLEIRNSVGRVSIFMASGGTNQGYISYFNANQQLSFGNGAATGTGANGGQQVNIDATGNLLVGTTSTLNGYSYSGAIHGLSTDAKQLNLRNSNATADRVWTLGMTSASEFIIYANGSTGQYMSWNGTSWVSSSDERTKTDLKPIENAIDKVSQLRSVTGRYKTDEENVSRAFLIAQDVQAVFPEAVDVRSDEDKTLGLRYTEMIPLLVASIKELKAIVDAQAVEIAALKSIK